MSRPRSFAEQALRRNWKGVLLLAAVAGVPLSWLLSTMPQTTYRVTQGYVAADVAEDGQRYVTANSDRAARDYAAVLRTDEALVEQIAGEIDVPVDDVRDRLSAGYLPGAGTLFVRYDAEDRREVLGVMAGLDRVLATDGAPAGGIVPGAVTPLGVPPVEQLGTRVNVFPGAGLVVALLGAAAAALLLERLRPQVADRAQVRLATERPVLDLDRPDDPELLAYRALSPGTDLVLVHGLAGADATGIADDLQAAAGTVPVLVVEDLSLSRSAHVTWVLVAPLPGSQRAIEDAVDELGRSADVVIAVRAASPQPVSA